LFKLVEITIVFFRYLAAKTCYFGVGGGTKAFTSLINNKPNFGIDTVKVIQDGKYGNLVHG
jgi:hypothetical protein